MKRPGRISRFWLVFLVLAGALAFYFFKRQYLTSSLQLGERVTQLPYKPVLNFFVIGDGGSGDESQWAVADAMERVCQDINGIDGLILLGDNFYKVGVSSVEDGQWKEKFEAPYGQPCLKRAPVYPVLGNHDYRGNTEAQILYHQKNPRWFMPARFYSVRFGEMLELIAADTAFPDLCFSPETCSLDFLHERLKHPARWTLVAAHHPLASASDHGYGHSGGFSGFVLRQIACGRADVWMSGHAHHLEHRKISGCEGSSMLVSGGGGASLYGIVREPESEFAKSEHGFLHIEATEKKLSFRFLGTDAQVLYSDSRSKP